MQRFISFGNDVYTALIIQSRYSRTLCLYAMHLRANKNHQGYSVYTESMIPDLFTGMHTSLITVM